MTLFPLALENKWVCGCSPEQHTALHALLLPFGFSTAVINPSTCTFLMVMVYWACWQSMTNKKWNIVTNQIKGE